MGQSADVVLDGTFETLKGTVTAVTGTDELSTGNLLVRTVTIRVNNAGGLTTAQAATASINGVSSIASATFAYQAERTLTALASGTVSAINVQEGDAVSKGDILIELTGDDLTESIQSASESLRSAEISMQNQQDNMSNYTITSPISGTIIEKDAKQGDALTSGSTLCVIYDLSYLEMVINVDELQIGALSVGQKVQLTADAVTDKTYVGTVTRVSMKGSSSGGTTTYPITIRIDDTDGLRPGMNANAEIVVAEANNALVVPNAAVIRGGYVLVSKKSPSAPALTEAGLLPGEDVHKHLKGCGQAILLAVTLGPGVDAQIRRAGVGDIAAGVASDALGSALAEQTADATEAQLRQWAAAEGKYLTGRFSPGYGDWDIAVQPLVAAALDTVRKAGLCVTDTNLMTPRKSVTALLGVSDHPVKGQLAGCGHCVLRTRCEYRKRGKTCASE